MKFLEKKCPSCNGEGHQPIKFMGKDSWDKTEIHLLKCFLCRGSGVRPNLLGAFLEDCRDIVGDSLIKLGENLKNNND